MNQETKSILESLHRKLEEEVGKRCPEEQFFCNSCITWRAYDMIYDMLDIVEDEE